MIRRMETTTEMTRQHHQLLIQTPQATAAGFMEQDLFLDNKTVFIRRNHLFCRRRFCRQTCLQTCRQERNAMTTILEMYPLRWKILHHCRRLSCDETRDERQLYLFPRSGERHRPQVVLVGHLRSASIIRITQLAASRWHPNRKHESNYPL